MASSVQMTVCPFLQHRKRLRACEDRLLSSPFYRATVPYLAEHGQKGRDLTACEKANAGHTT